MTQQVSLFNPPVFQLQPQLPPPQTVCGYLNEVGTNILNTTTMNGQPMNQDFWMSRQEFCQFITTNPSNNHIGTLDILKYTGSVGNKADIGDDSRPAVIWPRTYLLNSAQFVSPIVTYTFWAIKPLSTAGKIRFEYTPDTNFTMATGHALNIEQPAPTTTNQDGVDIPYPQDSRQRKYLWEWDLKTKNVFSLTFKGNIPIGAMPTTPGLLKLDTITNLPIDSGLPFYTTTFGTLSMYWQNAYIPGSIYPDTFNIAVFKSLTGTQAYLQTGFRNGSTLYIR